MRQVKAIGFELSKQRRMKKVYNHQITFEARVAKLAKLKRLTWTLQCKLENVLRQSLPKVYGGR
jgi:hypothetical protein